MTTGTELLPADSDRLTPIKVEEVKEQVRLIQDLMASVMRKDEHYGVIPGTQKPTLLKPGAEKLCFTFRLTPTFEVETIQLQNDHREYKVGCLLRSIKTGASWGQGWGSCSTMEVKYRYRESKRKCPKCGAETIRRAREDKGGGWYCWQKIGGCGVQFKAGDQSIESQPIGRIENPDIADLYNTALKMATKRAHVAATLYALAASDIFTQDLEDMGDHNDSPAAANTGAAAQSAQSREATSAGENASPPPAGDPSLIEQERIKVNELRESKNYPEAWMIARLQKWFPEKQPRPVTFEALTVEELRKLWRHINAEEARLV